MTTDGPYNESIRGPGNRGLGGIWALLNSIAGGLGSLPQIATDITAIRAHMDRALGVGALPAGFTSIPQELAFVGEIMQFIGTYFPAVMGQTPIEGAAGSLLARLTTINNALATNNSNPDAIGRSVPVMRSLITALQADMTILTGTVGNAATSTPNFSMLAWLALIANSVERSADCCEEANAPPPPTPPPTNPAPADFCDLFPDNAVRNSGFVLLADGQFANLPQRAYGLLWPEFSQISTITLAPGGIPSPGWDGLRSINALDYCLAWNFTGDNVPGQAIRHRTEEAWSTQSSDGANTVITMSVQGANAISTGAQTFFNYLIILDENQTLPGNNFFLRFALPGGGT